MRISKCFATLLTLAGMLLAFNFVSGRTPVFASVYFHSQFASDSQGCGTCHIAHFSETENLLAHGPSETDACYYCHGEGEATSGYDAETGMVSGQGGVTRPSYAGGFEKSVDPSRSYIANTVYENTSVHSIEKALRLGQLSQLVDGDIPGGSSWTGNFKCGSCHDPHGGGQYPSTPYRNPRLLRNTLLDEVPRYVYMSIDYGQTNLPLAYGAGFNQWCGGCHAAFNTEGETRTGNTGTSNGSMMKFLHKVGVGVPDHVFSTELGSGLPIPTDTKGNGIGLPQWRVSCLTCHRAHGSSVNVSVGFPRFNASMTPYGDDVNQSALLRLPEREVCVKCHGSAEYNKYNGDYGTGW
ncbi:MAG TPA: cytochrome c3 family protein [Desulfobacteria bacterium]|nr:cytochrome c3 family protein [Desulfobacteria bacterium]